ncbi:broad-complex core protein isoforms 1/2/3/4/5-like [Uranotaenia lowii]|uniref:broad-complex core protein isoforms 1/2/3/4/5-like n=1 Tax=Uranotaenia lowii TaxID=190385 RepID=UPI002479B268|nr:broad-complex core protein isoforms 1/2/3/4/5-like [Uranotaenia lowii]
MPLSNLDPLGGSTQQITFPTAATSSPIMPLSSLGQQFCLRWNNYHTNLSVIFDQLYQNGSFVDVTLVCEGRTLKAHKVVLAASSPYFETIFNETPCKHPIVIIKEVKFEELKALVEFVYRGEVNVGQEQIRPLLRLAEMFEIRGLTGVKHEEPEPEPVIVETTPNLDQFTVYTSSNVGEVYQVHNAVNDNDPNKKRDVIRKQTIETIEAPVEWPKTTDDSSKLIAEELKPKINRKRKQMHGTEEFSGTNQTFETFFETSSIEGDDSSHSLQPLTTVQQPTAAMVSHPPLSQIIPPQPQPPTVSIAAPINNPPTLTPMIATFAMPDETDTKISFLDTTNEGEDTSLNATQEWANANTTNNTMSTPASTATPTSTIAPPTISQVVESRSSNTTPGNSKQQKAPNWNWIQLQEAITAVVTQKLRFTQASAQYNIPKGTLYDNILGKSQRMAVLNELPLTPAEEAEVLDFCCNTSTSSVNKRTKKSLESILDFLKRLETFRGREEQFKFGGKGGFRWWWAFCRKHSVVSLYYEGINLDEEDARPAKRGRKSSDQKQHGTKL